MSKIDVKLARVTVPDYVEVSPVSHYAPGTPVAAPAPGHRGSMHVALRDLPREALEEMCSNFHDDVLAKAGFSGATAKPEAKFVVPKDFLKRVTDCYEKE